MNQPLGTRSALDLDAADWWRGAVIYQIYPRSFQDSNDDGIGDLRGILRRLGHVADLGADAIWISPFFTSPMKDFGYDVSDYRDVDPIFGTLQDFDAVVEEAHRLGLRVLIDQVISHTSDMHPWFAESRRDRSNPRADWYVWADAAPDGTPPTNWLSVFGGSAWEWDSRRCQYYLHNFLASQPDLNFHNPEVQDALLEVLKFWLDRGVDGFRLDTVNYYFHDRDLRDNPPIGGAQGAHDAPLVNPYGRQQHIYDKTRPENLAFLERIRRLTDRYHAVTTIGEVGDGDRSLETMAEYTAGGNRLHMCYTFDLLGPGYGRRFLETTVNTFERRGGGGWPCWALSNHDVPRHASRFLTYTGDPARQARLMAGVLLSLRGSVCIYQGEELGLTEADLAFEHLVDPYGIRFWPEFKGRDGCRTPMPWEADALHAGFSAGRPWLPVPPEHLTHAVDRQGGEHSVLAAYRRLTAFRRAHRPLAKGDIRFLDQGEADVLAFVRSEGNEAILCAFNMGPAPASLALPEGIRVEPLRGHGFEGVLEGGHVRLDPEDGFFGRID